MLDIHAKTLFLAAQIQHAIAGKGDTPKPYAPSTRQNDFVRLRAPSPTKH